MTIHPIVITGEPVLHKRAAEVEVFDSELKTLVDDMFETMDHANGAGLAAPQIGVGLRVFTYNVTVQGTLYRGVFVNPVLTTSKIPQTDPHPEQDMEGCLSVPGLNFPVQRADWARAAGFDASGNPIEVEGEGLLARCLQHEYDHLNGVLYVDRLIERYSKRAKKHIRKSGWGVPGNSWQPGVDKDPFGH